VARLGIEVRNPGVVARCGHAGGETARERCACRPVEAQRAELLQQFQQSRLRARHVGGRRKFRRAIVRFRTAFRAALE